MSENGSLCSIGLAFPQLEAVNPKMLVLAPLDLIVLIFGSRSILWILGWDEA